MFVHTPLTANITKLHCEVSEINFVLTTNALLRTSTWVRNLDPLNRKQRTAPCVCVCKCVPVAKCSAHLSLTRAPGRPARRCLLLTPKLRCLGPYRSPQIRNRKNICGAQRHTRTAVFWNEFKSSSHSLESKETAVALS
jgi:hypothetical protein